MTIDSHSPWEYGLFNQRSSLLFKEQVLALAAKINFGWVKHGWTSSNKAQQDGHICKTAGFISVFRPPYYRRIPGFPAKSAASVSTGLEWSPFCPGFPWYLAKCWCLSPMNSRCLHRKPLLWLKIATFQKYLMDSDGICIFLAILDHGSRNHQGSRGHFTNSKTCLLFEIRRNYAHDPHGSPHSRGPHRQNRGIMRVTQQLSTFLRIARCGFLWFQDIDLWRILYASINSVHSELLEVWFSLGIWLHIDRWRSRQGLKNVPQCNPVTWHVQSETVWKSS